MSLSRPWDPFSPHTSTGPPPARRVELPTDLPYLRKADLIELAEQHGVDPSGSRVDLINRLRALA